MDALPRTPAEAATPKPINVETDSTSSKEKQLTTTVADLKPEQDEPNPIECALPRQQLIIGYLVIFILLFVQELTSGIFRVLNPYVTSEFAHHSLTATTSVVSSIISAVINLPVAKLIELWGRMQVLALMVASMLLGIVLLASCRTVEAYCAAQVFYTVAFTEFGSALSSSSLTPPPSTTAPSSSASRGHLFSQLCGHMAPCLTGS
ncbi:hypothetical protein BB8028_0012g00140 [Beauveria bassiana]|uniref:Major facilitator superfamily (MFS) profile domain-containing protein n=1 Tax=Beauveria bassiana TaxID=176275 RepID=A0A2S7YPX3_BEABA|nr:hypothetical protein BB8028_0012g00140 [Beauveria bassiana]